MLTQAQERDNMKEIVRNQYQYQEVIYDPRYDHFFSVEDTLKAIDLMYEVAPNKKVKFGELTDLEEVLKWNIRTTEKMLEAGIITPELEDDAIFNLADAAMVAGAETDVYRYAAEYSSHLVIFRDKPRKRISPQLKKKLEDAPCFTMAELEAMA